MIDSTPREAKGARDILFARTREAAKKFGMDPGHAVDYLDESAKRYLAREDEFGSAPTRGEILRQLTDLAGIPDNSLPRVMPHIEALVSHYTIDALFGGFPAPSIKVRGRDAGTSPLLVPNRPGLDVTALKSSWAKGLAIIEAGGLGSGARRKGDDMTAAELIVKKLKFFGERIGEVPRSTASQILDSLSHFYPKELRRHFIDTRELLIDTFQVRNQRGGRNVNILEGIVASPDWLLVGCVLDLIWPIERGKMHASKMAAARKIIDETKLYAIGEEAAGRYPRKNKIDLVDRKILARVVRLRYQISVLNDSIGLLDKTLTELGKRSSMLRDLHKGRNEWDARWTWLSGSTFVPLRRWRRELERRLECGDYRPWENGVRRATGEVVQVPTWPKLRLGMNIEERTEKLGLAAQRLSNE